MLTREQLHTECRKIFDALPDRGETIDGVDDAVLKLNKQAAMAIDLEAELNEQIDWGSEQNKKLADYIIECVALKSKLDKVRELLQTAINACEKMKECGDLTTYGFGRLDALKLILSTLNEKGE